MAKILILDDESLSLIRLSEALTADSRHEVCPASDVYSCLREIESHDGVIDILLVDCSAVAPEAAGLLDRFLGLSPLSSVLVLTHSEKHHLSRRFPILRKPFTDEMLLESVNRLLDKPACSGICA